MKHMCETIQALRNAVGVGVSDFLEKNHYEDVQLNIN